MTIKIRIDKYGRKGNELPVHQRRCSGCKHNGKICGCSIYYGHPKYPLMYEDSWR